MNKMYIYEHCPYCTKARMIFGLKNIDLQLIYLPIDDHETPVSLVGVKLVPIWVNSEGVAINESLDIIQMVEEQYFPSLIEKKVEPFIESWLSENSSLVYKLAMPRWAKSDLPEFTTHDGRRYFTKKKESYLGSFEEHWKLTDQYLEMLQTSFENLEAHNEFFDLDQRPLQYGDIHFFAALKSLSIVKDLEWPQDIYVYFQKLSVRARIPSDHQYAL